MVIGDYLTLTFGEEMFCFYGLELYILLKIRGNGYEKRVVARRPEVNINTHKNYHIFNHAAFMLCARYIRLFSTTYFAIHPLIYTVITLVSSTKMRGHYDLFSERLGSIGARGPRRIKEHIKTTLMSHWNWAYQILYGYRS